MLEKELIPLLRMHIKDVKDFNRTTLEDGQDHSKEYPGVLISFLISVESSLDLMEIK